MHAKIPKFSLVTSPIGLLNGAKLQIAGTITPLSRKRIQVSQIWS